MLTKLDGEDKYEREEHKKAKYLRYSLDFKQKRRRIETRANKSKT